MLVLVGCGGDMGYPNDKAAVATGIYANVEQATVDEPDWEYIGSPLPPVDFQQLMAEDSLCPFTEYLQLQASI